MIINAAQCGQKIPHMWSKCVGAGRACEGLRTKWQEQLRLAVKECGFEYIRFHGLLSDDMFVCHMVNGKIQYNWYYIDSLYDFLLEIGIRPIVEFGFMPPLLASGEETVFWWKSNVTPPKDYSEWGKLISALVSHWAERYGLAEIEKWYYEIWNEPDLKGFWSGTKSQYFELYKISVNEIKKVDPKLRVGGPATSNFVPDDRFAGEREDVSKQLTNKIENLDSLTWKGVWVEDFLRYCEKEKLPVDFVSTHPYPTDFALDGQKNVRGRSRKLDSLKDDMHWIIDIVKKSAYPNAEINLTEWSSSPTSRDFTHDCLAEADYIIHSNLKCNGMANALSYWVFTDIFEEGGGGPETFHGGFGLLNMDGIRKPSYYAYKFMNSLGRIKIADLENGIITKNEEDKIIALLYNYPKEMNKALPISSYPNYDVVNKTMMTGKAKKVEFTLEGLEPDAKIRIQTLKEETTPFYAWANMNKPSNLTVEQTNILKAMQPHKEIISGNKQGKLDISINMLPWEVTLIEQL